MNNEGNIDLKVSLKKILKVYVATYFLSTLFDLTMRGFQPGTRSFLDSVLLHLLLFLFTYFIVLKKANVNLSDLANFNKIRFKDIGVLIVYSIVLVVINIWILRGIGTIGFFINKLSILFNMKLGIFAMTCNVLLIAVSEEYFSRAVLFNYFNKTLKKSKAFSVISTSVIFAILHFGTVESISLFSFASSFVFGVVLSLLYIKNYNLTPSIFVHFTYDWILNLIGLVLVFAH